MKTESTIRGSLVINLTTGSLFLLIALSSSCQKRQPTTSSTPVGSPSSNAAATPDPQTSPVEVRYFHGSGVVTKVVRENPYDKSLASVELNHGEIVGLMPAMLMEFYVKHVSLLDGLKVGDVVDFTIEEKGGSEIISELKKR